MMSSQYLPPRAYQGLSRLGDFLLPGTAHMPAFSTTHCLEHVDEMLSSTSKRDRDDLIKILTVFSVLPHWAMGRLLRLSGKASSEVASYPRANVGMRPINQLTLWFTTQLRLLDLGLRGVVFSLYYSGLNDALTHTPSVHNAMDFQLHCQPLDANKPDEPDKL